MRIPSGATDQNIFFVAENSAGARLTGLTAFTVYRSRNAGTATIYTTPTVAELSTANMPGVYALLVDEDTTIASGSDSEEYCVQITQASMLPVTRTIELYRRTVTANKTLAIGTDSKALISTDAQDLSATLDVNTKKWATLTTVALPLAPTVAGRTLDVSATGEAGVDWANVGSPTTILGLTNTTISSSQVVASVSGAVGSVTGITASDVNAIKVQTDKFTFTVPNMADVNIQYVNDVQVNGVGSVGNPWGP